MARNVDDQDLELLDELPEKLDAKQQVEESIASADEENKTSYWKPVIWISVLIFSILLLVSISVDSNTLINDHQILEEANITFLDFITLRIPDVSNPIGFFGAFFGYWLAYILGDVLCISLLLGLIVHSIFSIFIKKDYTITLIAVYLIVMAFFMNIIILTVSDRALKIPGVITELFTKYLNGIFSQTGTIIISGLITALMLLNIFGYGTAGRFFCRLFKKLIKVFAWIFQKREKKVKEEKELDQDKKDNKKIRIKLHNEKTEEEQRIESPITQTPVEIIKTAQPSAVNITKDQSGTSGGKIVMTDDEMEEKKQLILASSKHKKKNNYEEPKDGLYHLPDIAGFLQESPFDGSDRDRIDENISRISSILENKLAEFKVDATVKNVNIGPIVTQYELKPAAGVKVNRFSSLSKDLALALKAKSLRVEAPIPGKGLIGIEIPNKKRDIIFLRDIMLSDAMVNMESKLAFALGKDISGNPIVADLAKMPHLLIAGATGSGKSVCVNSIIVSLLLRTTPAEMRLILIDPKRIELAGYEGIPHLIQNVVTETEHVMLTLNWAVSEMEKRYKLLNVFGVRKLDDYNKKIRELKLLDESIEEEELPYIVLVIDEFSDLIMTATKEIETPITRLAQMARAIGIHLIIATQRPSNKVITGLIKANFPARVAFKVSQKINSRVILDCNGAEQLLGKGDSLFLGPGKAIPERIHGAYVSDEEINDLVDYLRVQPKPDDDIQIIKEDAADLDDFEFDDPLFPEAAFAVVSAGSASVSMLQRHFKVGYARAGRLIDLLEQASIVGPHLGSKSREVMASMEDLKRFGYVPEEMQ